MKLPQLAAILTNNFTTALNCLQCEAYKINGTILGDNGCFEGESTAGDDANTGCSTNLGSGLLKRRDSTLFTPLSVLPEEVMNYTTRTVSNCVNCQFSQKLNLRISQLSL